MNIKVAHLWEGWHVSLNVLRDGVAGGNCLNETFLCVAYKLNLRWELEA